MAMRELYYSGALSEFVAGYHGDCGECAELAMLHTLNPAKYPLDAAALSTIVHRDIAHGWASASGAEPISSIARDLGVLGEPYMDYGYSQPPTFDWRGQLALHGGVRAMVFELALAGRLPGDEVGVHYHFIACLGWDVDANEGIFADGDNAAVRVSHNVGPAGLVRYSLAQLEAAQVCGLLICDAVPAAPPPPPPAPAPAPEGHYTVRSGDTLSAIAARVYGHPDYWPTIYNANRALIGGNPNVIHPGEVLAIPPAGHATTVAHISGPARG